MCNALALFVSALLGFFPFLCNFNLILGFWSSHFLKFLPKVCDSRVSDSLSVLKIDFLRWVLLSFVVYGFLDLWGDV